MTNCTRGNNTRYFLLASLGRIYRESKLTDEINSYKNKTLILAQFYNYDIGCGEGVTGNLRRIEVLNVGIILIKIIVIDKKKRLFTAF